MFFEEQSGTAAFECLDDVCRRILWLEADEHVHMLWHDFQLFDGHIVHALEAVDIAEDEGARDALGQIGQLK